MSQNERVLAYMKSHTGITSMDAFNELGITRLSGRIFDLRQAGHNIVNVKRECINRWGDTSTFVEYRLV